MFKQASKILHFSLPITCNTMKEKSKTYVGKAQNVLKIFVTLIALPKLFLVTERKVTFS